MPSTSSLPDGCEAVNPRGLLRTQCGRGLGHAGAHFPDPETPNAGWWFDPDAGPKGSASSSLEPFMQANHPNPARRCQTVRASNGRQCVWHKELCDANEGHHDGIQSFMDAEAQGAPHVHEWSEWATSPNDHLLRGTQYAYCPCGASKARRAEPEAALMFHTDASECRSKSCLRGDHFGTPPKEPQEPACTHCEGPHDLEDCKGLEEPEEELCDCHEPPAPLDQHVEPPAPRRPPYAVAYAVEGGALYEVTVSGDATVVAEDGVLQVLHPKRPVLAIVRITPVSMEES